jgi:hypothetical protein
MPHGGHTSATLPERNEDSLPSNPPRKYSAVSATTRVNVVRRVWFCQATKIFYQFSRAKPSGNFPAA